MNKRFSTLLAAVLVAGGSSFNAFAQLGSDVESGDFVFLTKASATTNVLSFGKDGNNPKLAFLAKNNSSGFQGITGSFYDANVFDGINAALWQIEEIKPSDPAGVPAYRFINKKTQQVLAFELKNDTKTATGASSSTARVSSKARAIADGGNATWALTNTGVPYVVSGDSVFTLTYDFKLVSYKGKAVANDFEDITNVMKLAISPVSESMALTEKTFNQLLTDGKLYFNGGKDVSSTEKNVLTENSWEALPYATMGNDPVSGTTQFFLTNGSKVKGHSNNQSAVGDEARIDKKYFLVVDTLFNDKAGKYNKLAVDTIGYEPEFNATKALTNAVDLVKATTDRKLFAKRLPETAAFSATYYVGNDSIALKAVATPVKPNGTALQWVNTDPVVQAISDVKATDLYVNSDDNIAAIDALIAGYKTWKTTGWKTLAANAKFGDVSADAKLITDVDGLLSTTYIDALKATEVQTAHIEAADAEFEGVDADVLSAAELALASELQTHTALEALINAYKDWNVATQDQEGKFADASGSSDLISAVTAEKEAQDYDGDFDAFLSMVDAAECTKVAVTAVEGALENVVSDENVDAAKDASAYIYVETIDAAIEDYNNQLAQTPSEGITVSISTANAVKALGSLEAALITKMEAVEYATTQGAAMDYFYNGNNNIALQSVAGGAIALRNLSSVDVLTVTAAYEANDPEAAGYTEPLIQQYATAPSMGGSATIDVTKVYYIKDIQKYRAGEKNKGEGLFLDKSPVNTSSNYLAAGQDFNPYTQFVVEKAAGVDKGYYTIKNRATNVVYKSGLTDQLVGDSIVIAGDSIQLVAAGTEKASKFIGFKNIADVDLVNKSFKIHSASPYLKDMFLHMQKDSTLKLAEDEVLYELEAATAKPVQYGAKVKGIEDLYNQAYFIKNKKGEYLTLNADDQLVLSKDSSLVYNVATATLAPKNGAIVKYAFYFIATDAADSYVLAPVETAIEATADNKGYKTTVPAVGSAAFKVTVNAQTAVIEHSTALTTLKNDLFFVGEEDTPASLMTMPEHVTVKALNNDYVAMDSKNNAIVARVGDELKAATITDFTFWLDTAKYENQVTPSYYVTRGVAGVAGDEETEAVAAKRLYMYNAADSAAANADETVNPFVFGGETRVIFREASIMAQDTLLVPDATAKIDTVAADNGTSKDGLKHAVKAGVANFQFQFVQADKNGAIDEYCIMNGAGKYVHNLNGVLVMGAKDDALVVKVEAAEAPTANEGVEVSEVTVIAQNGAVRIANAEGKKVVITNILGQTIANTVITSSDAVIAAPAGVVVVAVEGEEAVKAIVK